MQYKELIGKKIGHLTIMDFIKKDSHRHVFVKCLCECGNFVIKRLDQLNDNSSCGCFKSKIISINSTKHGFHGSDLYNRYYGIKNRCYNKNNKYYFNYGGRGITMCDEWKNDFIKFKNWALENGFEEHLTIDRIDNNKGYFPENCRWVTKQKQDRNKRSNKNFTWRGETHCVQEWCEILGFTRDCLYTRLVRNKWDIEKAMTTPQKNIKRKVSA